jgi:hypothetical protein
MLCDGRLIAAVAGKGKSAVGKRENDATVAHAMTVAMMGLYA